MRVYHLLSAGHAVSNIALKRIRISRLRDLNDPFELLAAQADNKFHRKALRDWRDALNEEKGLLCFSQKWNNPVLWSHYAVKHRGMCLGFDLADHLASAVKYAKDRLPIRFVDDDPAKGLEESFVTDLLITKFHHWTYENEVRVYVALDHKEQQGGSYFMPFSDDLRLAEVIVGPACELPIAEVRTLVRANYVRVPVYKARLAFKWFDVVPDERSVKEEKAYWEERGSRGEPSKV
jgi:hypothetical protein